MCKWPRSASFFFFLFRGGGKKGGFEKGGLEPLASKVPSKRELYVRNAVSEAPKKNIYIYIYIHIYIHIPKNDLASAGFSCKRWYKAPSATKVSAKGLP